MLDGRVLGASQVEYKPFGKPPLKREAYRFACSPSWLEQRAAQPAHDGGPHVLVGLLVGDGGMGISWAKCRSMASQAAPGSVT